jgi:hypothetical protein
MAAPATAPELYIDAPVSSPRQDVLAEPLPLAPARPTTDFVYFTTLLGIPGSMATAFATMLLSLSYGAGAQMWAWSGMALLWGAYLAVMAGGWLAQANE